VNILILGHRGMLGHMVNKFLSTKNDCKIVTISSRWPNQLFKDEIIEFCYHSSGDFIINCIGAIHQKTNNFDVNIELPIWLNDNIDSNLSNCKIIHPGTDCEMDNDNYGNSKRKAAEYILKNGCITKIIKTSIIGFEFNSKASLLEWFLSNENTVNGYTNVFWNGNTTLQWAKVCYEMMINWKIYDKLSVIATQKISKYDLLVIMKGVFKKDIEILKDSSLSVDKCLIKTLTMKNEDIKRQLIEMKDFYSF